MPAVEDYDIRPDDIVIALMGVTGVGKSTFIQYFTDERVGIGAKLESCTSKVGIYKCHTSSIGKFYLIDTPGFDDTHRSDTEVLREVAFWLTESYKRKIKLTGIIYLHRINDVRVGNAALKNLRMFKRLCGTESLASVVLATTFWDKGPNYYTYLERERELQTNDTFWKGMIKNGSQVFRQDADRTSAKVIIDYLVQRDRESRRPTLDIQKQMVDEKKPLADTGAGQEVEVWLKQQREVYEKRLAQMLTEWKEALQEKDAEWQEELRRNTEEIKEKMKRDEEDRIRLRADNEALRQEHERQLWLREQQINEQWQREQTLKEEKAADAKKLKEYNDSMEAKTKELQMLKRKYHQLSASSCTMM